MRWLHRTMIGVGGIGLATLLGGCQEDAPAAPPGAQGPVLMRQWDAPGLQPIALVARTISHPSRDFRTMTLVPVLVRLPRAEGVAYIAAPEARYSARQITSGPQPTGLGDDLSTVKLTGPVHLSGLINGDLFIGRAAKATFDSATRTIELNGNASFPVELCLHGTIQRAPQSIITGERTLDNPKGHRLDPAPVSIAAALAALPDRLVFPTLTKDALDR